VGLHESVNSAAILRRAALEGSGPEAEIRIVSVIAEGSSAAQAAAAESAIATMIKELEIPGVGELAQIQIERGEPGPVLVRVSADADLLIVGACSNSEYRGIFSGSVVPFCLNRALCPVRVCADHGRSGSPAH